MSKVRFDFWINEREDAANEKYLDLNIKRDYSKEDKPVVTMWQGKQSRPFSRYFYQNIQRAEASILKEKQNAEARQARKDEEKRVKEELKTAKPTLVAGDILNTSWGYDQTNVEYYLILEIKGKTAILQEIGQDVQENCYMSGITTPVPTVKRGEPFQKKICMRSYDGVNVRESVKISECQRATKWDGRPNHVSWYA